MRTQSPRCSALRLYTVQISPLSRTGSSCFFLSFFLNFILSFFLFFFFRLVSPLLLYSFLFVLFYLYSENGLCYLSRHILDFFGFRFCLFCVRFSVCEVNSCPGQETSFLKDSARHTRTLTNVSNIFFFSLSLCIVSSDTATDNAVKKKTVKKKQKKKSAVADKGDNLGFRSFEYALDVSLLMAASSC